MGDSSTEGLSTGCSGVTFHASLAAWSAATTGSALQVTFEEALWPVNQSLTGPWTLNGLTFQGFAGTPVPNIFVANFGSPFGSPQWLTANGDESIDITPAAPLNAIAFDAKSNGLGSWGGSSLGDLNCDGTVDGADLGVLLGAWTG